MLQFLNHNTAHYKRYNNDRLVMRDVIRHDALLWLVIFSTALIGIHIRLHPDNINRDGGIEIPEAWMPTIKKHNNGRSAR